VIHSTIDEIVRVISKSILVLIVLLNMFICTIINIQIVFEDTSVFDEAQVIAIVAVD
jgi:hypothetical protein